MVDLGFARPVPVAVAPSDLGIIERFTEKQLLALRAFLTHKYTLYGGALGGGKSYLLRWVALWYAIYLACVRKVKLPKILIVSSSYRTLADRQTSKIEEEFPSYLGKSYSKHAQYRECFIISARYGSGVILFRSLDDPDVFKSGEYCAIFGEEFSENSYPIFDKLRQRLRFSGLDDDWCRMLLVSNPGGVGHGWLKGMFMDGIRGPEWTGHEAEFSFVPANVDDNPHVSVGYRRSLDTLPELERRAMVYGDWSVFAGQAFSHVNEMTHGIDPVPVPENSPILMTYDWGMGSPFSIGWWFVDNDGRLVRFAEWYGASRADNRGLNLTDSEVAAGVKDREKEWGWWDGNGHPTREIDRIAGHDCFVRRVSATYGAGPTTNDVWGEAGMYLRRGDIAREAGYRAMHERLKLPAAVDGIVGRPMMVAFKTCENFFRKLSNLPTDPLKGHNDVDTKAEDHLYDECRLAATARPLLPEVPEAEFTTRGARDRAIVEGRFKPGDGDGYAYPEAAMETLGG